MNESDLKHLFEWQRVMCEDKRDNSLCILGCHSCPYNSGVQQQLYKTNNQRIRRVY